jgi:hypothetical protein
VNEPGVNPRDLVGGDRGDDSAAATRNLPPNLPTATALACGEIALAIQPGAHVVLFVDQAGWHVTSKLQVPKNMTLV